MIYDSDVMIAEVTNPSLGVGYELAYAEKLNTPILCLFKKDSERKLSAMVSGNRYNVIEYIEPHDIEPAVARFIGTNISH